MFNAGSAAIEALNAGAIDAAFIGPNPAINAWTQSRGSSIRIVSGATSGGAQFVVKPGITAEAASLRPKGEFVTTHLVVSQRYLQDRPDQVKALLTGVVATLDAIKANPAKARTEVNLALKELTGKALDDVVLARAWDNLQITVDPIATSLQADLDHAVDVGISKSASLNGIYELSILNGILTAQGKPPVSAGSLGV